jgi:hypothetical protein
LNFGPEIGDQSEPGSVTAPSRLEGAEEGSMYQRSDQVRVHGTNLAPILARASEALLLALVELKTAGYQEGKNELSVALLKLHALGRTVQEKERVSKS